MAVVPAVKERKLSLEEFHNRYSGEKPYFEYWDGEAVQKSMPTRLHALIQKILVGLLDAKGFDSGQEITLKLDPAYEPIPDVIAADGRIEDAGLDVEGDGVRLDPAHGARRVQHLVEFHMPGTLRRGHRPRHPLITAEAGESDETQWFDGTGAAGRPALRSDRHPTAIRPLSDGSLTAI